MPLHGATNGHLYNRSIRPGGAIYRKSGNSAILLPEKHMFTFCLHYSFGFEVVPKGKFVFE